MSPNSFLYEIVSFICTSIVITFGSYKIISFCYQKYNLLSNKITKLFKLIDNIEKIENNYNNNTYMTMITGLVSNPIIKNILYDFVEKYAFQYMSKILFNESAINMNHLHDNIMTKNKPKSKPKPDITPFSGMKYNSMNVPKKDTLFEKKNMNKTKNQINQTFYTSDSDSVSEIDTDDTNNLFKDDIHMSMPIQVDI
jgi:hypothetical protein